GYTPERPTSSVRGLSSLGALSCSPGLFGELACFFFVAMILSPVPVLCRQLLSRDLLTVRCGFAVLEQRFHAYQILVQHTLRPNSEEPGQSMSYGCRRRVVGHQQVDARSAFFRRLEARDAAATIDGAGFTSPHKRFI